MKIKNLPLPNLFRSDLSLSLLGGFLLGIGILTATHDAGASTDRIEAAQMAGALGEQ